jgi:hypothetical protein
LSNLHKEFYQHQLEIREAISRSSKRKRLIEDLRGYLGDHYVYVEHFVKLIRNDPSAFNLIVSCCDTNLPFLDMLAESFTYSFFEDLMNPEGTELELLKVLRALMQIEFKRHPHTSDIFNENVSSVLGKILTIYTKRRPQRKYLRLVMKKPLMKIMNGEECDLSLDPKTIYQRLNLRRDTIIKMDSPVRLLTPRGQGHRSSWFSSRASETIQVIVERERSYEDMHDSSYYLEDTNVREQIDLVSSKLIEHCRLILSYVYSNVHNMPYGVRWICKSICELTAERSKGQDSEAEQRMMLGTFLFTKWWLVAIATADSSGLINDTVISEEGRASLGFISNVRSRQILKQVCRENTFEYPQFDRINKFILEEIPNMRQFFHEVVNIEDFVLSRRQSRLIGKPKQVSSTRHTASLKNYKTMALYYAQTLSRPAKSCVMLDPSNSLDLDRFEKFRFQAIALTVPEVRVLVDLVISNEPLFTSNGLGNLVKTASRIKRAIAKDNLFAVQPLSHAESGYLLFTEEVLPNFEQTSKTGVIKMNEDYYKRLTLSKVKDAVCDLLFCLDSFAMFFERIKNCSLLEIIDFVLKFSYLFEYRKGTERVPVKLLAHYLDTHLKLLPEAYSADNYALLYKTLLEDYEQRFNARTRIASLEKQLLLLAVNMMEKHLVDMRQEAKLQQSYQHLRSFLNLVKKTEVSVCVALQQSKNRVTVVVLRQRECLHVRAHSMTLLPKYVKRNMSKSVSQLINLGRTQGHVSSIDEFADQFSSLEQVARSTLTSEDSELVVKSYRDYLNIVKEEVLNSQDMAGLGTENMLGVADEIEGYLMRRMFKAIFPAQASKQDIAFHRRTLELDWVTPDHLDILPSSQNVTMWKFAVEALDSIDERVTPEEKVGCIAEFVTTVVNILHLCSSVSAASADDSLPIIIYLLIKAQPRRLPSNINYIAKFRQQSKLMSDSGFCFSQLRSAMTFIETLDHTCLTITSEVFLKSCEEARMRNELSS